MKITKKENFLALDLDPYSQIGSGSGSTKSLNPDPDPQPCIRHVDVIEKEVLFYSLW
jgi:hypothetical protein